MHQPKGVGRGVEQKGGRVLVFWGVTRLAGLHHSYPAKCGRDSSGSG